MQTFTVRYVFSQGGLREEIMDLIIDSHDLLIASDMPGDLPDWTYLDFNKCPHCTLTNPPHSRCPLAVRLVGVVRCFDNIVSYDRVLLKVETGERTVSQETTAQRAISSIMGLISATSGCPHTVFFRPMARFHLPLASESETVYRVTSMYLLGQYFRIRQGLDPDFTFRGLVEIYRRIELVNQTIAKRIKAASGSDSTVNAIILLDIYAKVVPFVVEDSLEDLKHLFRYYSIQP